MNSSFPNNNRVVTAWTITTGVKIPPQPEGGQTLAATTYFYPVYNGREGLVSVHMAWSAALAAVITYETTNFPEYDAPWATPDDPDVSIIDDTAGNWMLQNPTTAYVPIVGASNTVSSMTITAGGAAAGGAWLDIGNTGAARGRLRVVVSTGGVLRVATWGKLA